MEDSRWVAWTPSEVERWVAEDLGFPEYAPAFAQNRVDGPTLAELTDETLEEALAITDAIHRKKVIGHIKLLKIKIWGALDNFDGVDNMPDDGQRSGGRTPRGGQPGQRRVNVGTGASGNSTPRRGVGRGRGRAGRDAPSHPRGPYYSGGEYADTSASHGYPTDSDYNTSRPGVMRSRSAGAERRVPSEHEYCSDRGSHWEETSVYSCFTNPDLRVTDGLGSYFGIDSPSYSRTGNFSRSSRDLYRKSREGPGPASYQTATSYAHSSSSASAPRAVIPRAPRNTAECLISASPSPGPVKYHASSGQSSKKIKGGTMGRAARVNYRDRLAGTWLQPKEGPGPADYRPLMGMNSTFHR